MKKSRGYWTKERIIKEARKYKTRAEWRRGNESSITASKRKDCYKEASAHFVRAVKLITKEDSILMAKKVNRRVDFIKQYPSYYAHALKKGYLEECCKHMMSTKESSKIGSTKWTKEALIKEALKYSKRGDFFKKASGAYDSARTMGVVDEICSHMTKGPYRKWTKEKLRIEALKYKNKLEFSKKNDGALRMIYTYKYQDELLSHMPTFEEQMTKWTEKTIISAAKKCKTKTEFRQKYPGAYFASKAKNIMHKIEHFEKTILRIEVETLHPKIDRILLQNKLIKTQDYFYNKRFIQKKETIIPDYILIQDKTLYILEAKTCACYPVTVKEKRLDQQVKDQIKAVSVEFKDHIIKHIIVSELGTISSEYSNHALSLEGLDFLIKNKKIPKKSNVKKRDHYSLGLKIRNQYRD